MDSSYMALDILYRQGQDIKRAESVSRQIASEVSYSSSIINTMSSSWKWLMSWVSPGRSSNESVPSTDKTSESTDRMSDKTSVSTDRKTASIEEILKIQKSIGDKLDGQISSLIYLERDTDKLIGRIDDNTRLIRNV